MEKTRQDPEQGPYTIKSDDHADEHILVCLSSSPSNAKIIRTGARMARAFRGMFTALYVETPATALMSDEDKKRLRENTRLAEQLGATVETSYGEDVPFQIAEFARLSGISKIVIGRSTAVRKGLFHKPTLTDRLIALAPNMDIHVIPDASAENAYRERKKRIPSIHDVSHYVYRHPAGGIVGRTAQGQREAVRPRGLSHKDSV